MDVREKLIEEVKKNPALYDKTDEDYKKYELRVQIWTAIGRKFGLSASDAQAKWKNLRDNMVKHLKKKHEHRRTEKNQAVQICPDARLHRAFLIVKQTVPLGAGQQVVNGAYYYCPYVGKRSNDQTEETNGLDLDCQNADNGCSVDDAISSGENSMPEQSNSYTCPTVGHIPSHSSSPSSSFSNSVSPPPPKRQRHAVPNRVESAVFDRPPRLKTESVDHEDDIGLFLSSMAGSIRKLPADVQAKVRFSIHQIVHDAEMEYLYPRLKEDRN